MKLLKGLFNPKHFDSKIVKKEDLLALSSRLSESFTTKTSLIPTAKTVAETFGRGQMLSADLNKVNSGFMTLRLGNYPSVYYFIYKTLDNLSDVVGKLDELIENKFGDATEVETMDVSQFTIMAYMSRVYEFLDFAARFLAYTVDQESAVIIGHSEDKEGAVKYSAGDHEAMTEMVKAFYGYAPTLVMSYSEIRNGLMKMPPSEVAKAMEVTQGFHDMRRFKTLNPLKMNFIGINYGLFYHIGAWIDDIRVNRYKERKDEIVSLSAKVRRLHELKADPNNRNPRLDRTIEVYEERLRVKRERNADFEKELGYS